MKHYLAAFRRYVDFRERSSRTEYWMFVLFNVIVYGVLVALGAVNERLFALVSLYFFASLIPLLALGTRRLHDQGSSGWWLLIGLLPFGSVVLIVLFCLPGTPGPNRYGPDPRGPVEQPLPNPWADDVQESKW
jgi:uncharacterized membrane protein YhaH (DUF805 family)